MTIDSSLSARSHASPARPTVIHRFARRILLDSLSKLRVGSLVLHEGSESRAFGPDERQAIHVHVQSPRVYTRLLREGALGAARAWIDGDWECEDLTALLRMLLVEPGFAGPSGRLDGPIAQAASLLRTLMKPRTRNSRRGSRRNISAHYDLGNDFFERMLDPSMTYSSAIFASPDLSREQAQHEKYDRLCRRIGVESRHRLLEIGSGWGGFAMHAARHYGCQVTTTTISREQHDHARERIAAAGLGDRIEVLFEDYRELRGRFDRVVSIEMIEAVGAEYLDTFFRVCSDRLESDGAMGLQAIVIADQRYQHSLRHIDFIKQYVFPGGFLPSIAAMAGSVAAGTDLRIHGLEDISRDYAETLRRWRAKLDADPKAFVASGRTREFMRLWHYYLAYCEAGFEERHIGCVQLALMKSGWRPD